MESQMQRPAPQHIESGESNQPGEKKSMFKKVKDKAKKIKDSIKKPGQGKEHEYRYDEHVDEEDDDDEEIANDREIHGAAPTHDSTVINSKNLPMQLDQNAEKPAADTRDDRIDPMVKGEAKTRPNIPAQTGYEQENPSENKHFPPPSEPVSVQREEEKAGEPEVKLGPSMGLEEDPHSTKSRPGDAHVPPSNYESKVSDPTGDGGKEAGVGQLIHRFDHLNVGNESETKQQQEKRPYTGSHDQFNPESDPKNSNTPAGNVSSATSAISDKAFSAKNVVASKLGYGGGSGQEGPRPSNNPESESSPGYTQRITDTLNPVYEKVSGAGTAVMSKFQGGGEAGKQGEGYGEEGMSPSNKPGSESGGGEAGKQGERYGQEGMSPSNKPGSESTPGYTQRITETLNPVYEKVAGAGTTVMSKFQGGGDTAATGTDKGVSAKDSWDEKLKPGDEDKALSETITDSLQKKKEGYFQKTGEEKPIEEVTEGKEGKREGEDALDAGRQSSGPGVVSRVKDTVGSWMGMGTGTQTAEDSINKSHVDNAGEQQQPRLQE